MAWRVRNCLFKRSCDVIAKSKQRVTSSEYRDESLNHLPSTWNCWYWFNFWLKQVLGKPCFIALSSILVSYSKGRGQDLLENWVRPTNEPGRAWWLHCLGIRMQSLERGHEPFTKGLQVLNIYIMYLFHIYIYTYMQIIVRVRYVNHSNIIHLHSSRT